MCDMAGLTPLYPPLFSLSRSGQEILDRDTKEKESAEMSSAGDPLRVGLRAGKSHLLFSSGGSPVG